jgi:hypothetical protein
MPASSMRRTVCTQLLLACVSAVLAASMRANVQTHIVVRLSSAATKQGSFVLRAIIPELAPQLPYAVFCVSDERVFEQETRVSARLTPLRLAGVVEACDSIQKPFSARVAIVDVNLDDDAVPQPQKGDNRTYSINTFNCSYHGTDDDARPAACLSGAGTSTETTAAPSIELAVQLRAHSVLALGWSLFHLKETLTLPTPRTADPTQLFDALAAMAPPPSPYFWVRSLSEEGQYLDFPDGATPHPQFRISDG